MEPLTAEQVKAARALLAWSQQELAAAARVSVSTIADFERGMRTPVANNAQAIREGFEQKGLQFVAGGVVEKAMLPAPPSTGRPGGLVRWVNTTHLSQWGGSRDGQSGMPELLRRLIYATLGPAALVRFPADESVQFPGWDGVSTVSPGGLYVPSGDAVWEIGAQRTRIRAKADEDYEKRTKDPIGRTPSETTFVFVTPQRFPNKDAWVAEKKAEGAWRSVVAIDGDDLVHWLEMFPAVAQWLSVKIGRRPQGLRNLEEAWAEWVRATQTPLTPGVVLTSRDTEQTKVLKWLRAQPGLFSLQAEAPEEAIAFLYAAISPLPAQYRLHYLSRCVLADNAETARQLIGLGTPMIVVLTDPEPGWAQRLVDDDHHVFAAYGPDANNHIGADQLPRPWRFDLQMSLTAAGVSEPDAHRLAHLSGRSITVLRRLMPAAPNAKTKWAEQAPPELVAAMFAGAWSSQSVKDRKLISDLAGRPYDQVETVLAQLASALDGPIVQLGPVWKVVSLRDLWIQIGAQVTPDQFSRFEKAIQSVLGAINPRYATPRKSPYYEADDEYGEEHSGALRRGLTEAMIAIAVFPGQARLVADADRRVERAVHKLLDGAPAELWWSLSGDFRNLAEASPKAFLDALELGLEGSEPAVRSLFRSDEGLLQSQEYLSNLLWALETLARSKDYLLRAALVLAQLDAIDPGGRWGNRPGASLRRIFVSWSPQTYATPAQRLKVIDRIVRDLPDIGWKLLMGIAPKFHDSSEPAAMPHWRDFAPEEPEAITWTLVAEQNREAGARLLKLAASGERWQALLDLWGNFDPDWRAEASQRLLVFAEGLQDPDQVERMRDKLRTVLEHHRAFPSADWSMADEDLAALDKAFSALQPRDVEHRVRWLFRPGAAKLRADMDWAAQRVDLEAAQVEAAIDLMGALSADGLFAFAETITMRNELGVAIAKAAPDDAKFSLMKRGLLADQGAEVEVGGGIMYATRHFAGDQGEAWVRALWARAIDEGWGERAETRIVQALPLNAVSWADIGARSPQLEDAYWRQINIYQIPGDADAGYVAERLNAVGRNRAAMGWLGHHIALKPPGSTLVRVMRDAAKETAETDQNDAVMFAHWAGVVLDYLDTAEGVTEQEIVSLEWTYYQVLQHSQRPARTLRRALAKDPEFFVHLLKLVYVPAEDSGIEEPEPENPEIMQNLASQAWQVLREWDHIPGADDGGAIDPQALETWVKRARKLLAEAGRGEVGDSKIGEILSAAKREPDEPWPPEPVREIIEMVRSRALERGFEIGLYNRRGVTVRMPHDGGAQERALAERYRRDAESLRFDWPRTSACLDRIATTYQVDAEREDLSADQRDWL